VPREEKLVKQAINVATFAICLALASPAPAADQMKIGSVDIQKVLVLSDAGQEGKAQLSAKAEKLEKQKDLRTEELSKLKAALEKDGVLLSEKERSDKEKEYEQKFQEFQEFIKSAQEDFQSSNAQLTTGIVEEIVKVVEDYGRKNGYSFIFLKNEYMIYADEKTDLTEEILNALNALKKASSNRPGPDEHSPRTASDMSPDAPTVGSM